MGRVFLQGDTVADRCNLAVLHAYKAFGFNEEAASCFVCEPKPAGKLAFLHVQAPLEIPWLPLMQIQLLLSQSDINAYKVHRIQYFCVILGVADFPPSYDSAIWVVHTGYVRSLQAVTGVCLFKVAPHSHIAVAEGGDALHNAVVFRLKPAFNNFPRMDLQQWFQVDPSFMTRS